MATSGNALGSIPTGIHRIGFFPRQHIEGDLVQIDIQLIKAVLKELGFRDVEGDTNTLVILPLALQGDAVDFHLSFAVTAGYSKQCHFCIRLEGRQNECLYEHYSLKYLNGRLYWSFQGSAGQGNLAVIRPHIAKGVVFTAFPLNQFLNAAEEWITSHRARLYEKKQGTLNEQGKRIGTHTEWTLERS